MEGFDLTSISAIATVLVTVLWALWKKPLLEASRRREEEAKQRLSEERDRADAAVERMRAEILDLERELHRLRVLCAQNSIECDCAQKELK